MRRTGIKFGFYGAITICALFLLNWFTLSNLPYFSQELVGYITMVLSLSFVYFGIKQYRDNENHGTVSFKKALLIGLLISLITALAFGVLDVFYTQILNPDFSTEYYNHSVEALKATLPQDEYQAKLAELESQKELFSNPLFSFTVMALTVFVIGFIISLLSALVLQKK